jgi:tellurite resistance protein
MKDPTLYHLLTFLYISFAKESNGKLAPEEEAEIKTIIARWMNVDYRNINDFERVIKESLTWFNEVPQKDRMTELLKVVKLLTNTDGVDLEMKKKILSEIRDISVADGRYDKYEKAFHDEIAHAFGIGIDSSFESKDRTIGFRANRHRGKG